MVFVRSIKFILLISYGYYITITIVLLLNSFYYERY